MTEVGQAWSVTSGDASVVSTGAFKHLYWAHPIEREFLIDNLLVRTHFIMMMIWWTGLAPWEFEFPLPGSLTSTFLHQDLTQPAVEPIWHM